MKTEKPTEEKKEVEKTSSDCHPETAYSTTHEFRYGFVQNNANEEDECPKLDAQSEANAVNAAWKHFNDFAKNYCAQGDCAGDKTCKDAITNRSAKKGALRRKFTPGPTNPNQGTLECFVTIEVTAKISCSCA